MNYSLKKFACCAATSALLFIPAANTWAVPVQGAAHLFARESTNADEVRGSERQKPGSNSQQTRKAMPAVVRFREVRGLGLLIPVWINGSGPYNFAIDTGAGATILSRRVANEARVKSKGRRPLIVGGISGRGSVAGDEVSISTIAAGDRANLLPSNGAVVVIEALAPGLDGVLDPVESYSPLGFDIDIPRGLLTAFDPRVTPLRRSPQTSSDEAVVSWLVEGGTRRPFVALEGRRALVDTGSGLGLGLTLGAAVSLGIVPPRGRGRVDQISDLGGGSVSAHRIAPATVRIGPLVLRGIPTDLLPNADVNAPILLGRDALRPFRITFDPLNRLVRFIAG